jgi:hypothetical protein
MLKTQRDKIIRSIDPGIRYAIYEAPGLSGIVQAFREVLSGKQVMILFPEDMERGDDWRHLVTLPSGIAGIPRSLLYRKRLQDWVQLAPHLFRPVKSVYAGKVIPKWKIYLMDRLAGNDFQKRSVSIRLQEIPQLGELPGAYRDAWLFEETMVNISRLKLELLKEIHARGGIVLNYAMPEKGIGTVRIVDRLSRQSHAAGMEYLCMPESVSQKQYILPSLPWKDFSMHLLTGKYRISLTDYSGDLGATVFPWPGSTRFEEILLSWLDGIKSGTYTHIMISADEEALKKRLPGAFASLQCKSAVGGRGKNLVEDYLETAYDLAKQTGIGFWSSGQYFTDMVPR